MPALFKPDINSEYLSPKDLAAAFILIIHSALNSRFLFLRSRYAYNKPFSTAFLATVYTFFLLPKYPLACFNIFFFLDREAVEFTDLGISL